MDTKSNPRKFNIGRILLWLAATLLILAAFSAGSGQALVLAETTKFYDDFTGPDLGAGWVWPEDQQLGFDFKEVGESTFITFPVSKGESTIDLRNLLLRPVAPGDFSIETRVLFEPDTNFQFAGLVIYQDGANFLQLGRAFCDLEEVCQGNAIYFDKVITDSFIDGNFATPIDSPEGAYLRLERRGEMVRGFFSFESVTWTEIGTHWIPADFQVNGVGLAVSQSIAPDQPISADFDFFELSEGWGFLPEGFHDYEGGDVPNWACNAGGWAADPDDRQTDLAISIAIDGVEEEVDEKDPDRWWVYAGGYREDLDAASVCVDGTCSFETSLLEFPRMSLYEPHQITVYAQSVPEGDWVRLNSSPKDITCRTYDIYAFDPTSGETRQITDLRASDEYNPSWSPNGKQVAHDVVYPDGSQELWVTDVASGVSTPLVGAGGGGNDAAWSPNGKLIAFDTAWAEIPTLYIIPAVGGTPSLVRENAISPDWAPSGQRLVFQDPTDGSLRTIPVGKAKGVETRLVDYGNSPAWSPDGNWIAYESGSNIWKIAVNVRGSQLGEPIQLTSLPTGAHHPTWSPDSQSITFESGMTGDNDLWTVPAAGGEPAWLTGVPNFGDWNPSAAHNSPLVAYASISPDGQAPRSWISAYSADLEPGYWDAGTHTYQYRWQYDMPEPDETEGMLQEFLVAEAAPLYDGYALLRQGLQRGIRTPDGWSCEGIGEVNPEQPTRLITGWVTDYPMTYSEALAHFASLKATARIDGATEVELAPHEFFSASSIDWAQYVCAFTEAPLKMDLRVNYGLDWVESFYEAGHAVQITVTDGEGNVKHTAEAFTEAFEWTPGYFNLDKDAIAWNPSPLDVEPGDWVFAEVDNGATAQVQIGVINGTIDLAADSISGTVEAAWITEPVQIECLDWGSGGDFGNKDGGTILTDGLESYSCSWAGEGGWDIDYYQNVGIAYIGPDGHWVANAFYQEEEFSGQAQIYTGEGGATPVDSLAAPISRPVYRLMRKPLALLYKQIG